MSAVPAMRAPVAMPNSTCGASMLAQGFGTWQAAPGLVYQAVKAAIVAGYRLIDCAKIYRNQEEVGRAISEVVAEGICTRKDLFIVSKVWNTDHAAAAVDASTRHTVAQLQCTYLDLLLIHWPVSHKPSPNGVTDHSDEAVFPKNAATGGSFFEGVPVAETWAAMEKLVAEGLVKDIGLSNFTVGEVEEVLAAATVKPAALQIEVHPGLSQTELRGFCAAKGLAVMAYCPLGIGMDDPATGLLNRPAIQKLAEEHKMTSAQMLLQWSSQVGCVCLSKSVTPARIAENAAVPFGGLPDSLMAALAELDATQPLRVCNPPFFRAAEGPFFN